MEYVDEITYNGREMAVIDQKSLVAAWFDSILDQNPI